jgi:hypothetical protein
MELRVNYHIHRSEHWPLSWTRWIQPTHSRLVSLKSIFISSHPHQRLLTGFFPSGFSTKTLYAVLSHVCNMLCPLHRPWFDHSSNIWWGVQVMKLFIIMQFSPPSYTSSLLGLNVLLSNLFSSTLSLCSSLNVRDQVSHPYKTTGEVIVLHILIVWF